MLPKNDILRPSWMVNDKENREIDLSKNVHFDSKLNLKVKELIDKKKYILNYGNEFSLYEAICGYYNLDIGKVAIGYGAADILQRVIFSLNIDKLYIVKHSFAMIEIYCKMINLNYEIIDLEDLKKKNLEDNSAMYIANPNGFDGTSHDISELKDRFKFLILDEVYSDFSNKFSLLNKFQSNFIIIKSLSKSLGIAGLRVGFSYSSAKIANEIQKLRTSQVSSSIASIVVPEIISLTDEVIMRMIETKNFLEQKYDCKKSVANYVLFKKQNKYTKVFGSREIDGFHRMALTDMKTLNTV
jgi:histidinol-phosphate/aromatic aminotransferase/cobyric acid decarboxylase-like protein